MFTDAERTALADALDNYAEGVWEVLRDDNPGETFFPVVEDLEIAADRIREGAEDYIDRNLFYDLPDALALDSAYSEPDLDSALAKIANR